MIHWLPDAGPFALRTFDHKVFNAIARHPEVLPWLGFPPEIASPDYTATVNDPNNYAFLTRGRDGCLIFVRAAPGLYHVHTMAMPTARGAPMVRLTRDALAFMFLNTDCHEITTMVPDDNPAAAWLATKNGFKEVYRREGIHLSHGKMIGLSYRSLRLEDYVARSKTLEALGELFHGRLVAAGVEINHDDDPIHDRWVGAALGMVLAGNAAKAVGSYNRWASVAQYQPVNLVSVTPILVDFGTAYVQIQGGAIEILKGGKI